MSVNSTYIRVACGPTPSMEDVDKLVRAVADLTAAACQTQAGGELLDSDPEAFLNAIVKAVKSGKEIDVDTMFDDVG